MCHGANRHAGGVGFYGGLGLSGTIVCSVGACRLSLVVSKGVDQIYDRVNIAAELRDFTSEDIK